MNCPVCARSLAETLSICPSCGAMKDDSVREELQTKITQGVPIRSSAAVAVAAPSPVDERKPLAPRPAMITPQPMAPALKVQTAELVAPKTSPTLVGFQAKNTSVPDWRLQMQNAVQQRKGNSGDLGRTFPTNGGAALKAEPIRAAEPALEIADTRVANALRRIEESRKAFLEPAPEPRKATAAKAFPPRPFGVVTPTGLPTLNAGENAATIQKPRLVTPFSEKRNTNKLPPLGEPVIRKVEDVKIDEPEIMHAPTGESSSHLSEFGEIKRIRIKAETESAPDAFHNGHTDEIEDLAPFSMRFGAGLFDFIIGTFATMLILAPLAFSRSDWFTARGISSFLVTWVVVMFVYMTACLGFYGKTLGMRLFSLELVDAVENEYPTLHQAAINSFLFMVSIGFAGVGFLTMLFNDEKRAAHDLVSGTILVREF